MNDTLKVAGRIGAELGAAKAENEKLRNVLQWIADHAFGDNGNEAAQRANAALSQQAESECRCTMRQRLVGDGCSVCNPELAAELAADLEDDEQAPAQDERTAFEAWVMQHNTAVREDYDDTDENAPEDIRLDRQGGVYIWANAEAAWFAWKARSALDTRPAQPEQQPVGWPALVERAAQILDAEQKRLSAEGYLMDSEDCIKVLREALAAPIAQTAPQGKFRMGDLVKKSTGSEWQGRICGTYSTSLTPEGYAVESEAHAGSVQIYPAKALELVPMAAKEA